MIKRVIILLIVIVPFTRSIAQVDPHFSQYYSFPLWLNPGMTGVMDGTYRATAVYRNQWNKVLIPFSTSGFSFDFSTTKNLNLGVNILSQSAGDGGYKFQQAALNIAYSGIRFGSDKAKQITFGISAGFLGRRFDPTKFQAGDQWNPGIGFDPSIASADVYPKTSAAVLDMGAGVSFFDGSLNQNMNFFAGFSASHLTQPYDPFLANNAKGFLPIRFIAHAGAKIYVSDNFSVTPNMLFMKQGNATEKMAGITGERQVADGTWLLAGVNYRFKDAIAPMIGLSFNKVTIGVSYDVNNSDLGKAVGGANAFEISIGFMGGQKGGKRDYHMACPRF